MTNRRTSIDVHDGEEYDAITSMVYLLQRYRIPCSVMLQCELIKRHGEIYERCEICNKRNMLCDGHDSDDIYDVDSEECISQF